MDVSGPLHAFGRGVRSVGPERKHLKADLLAGLPGAISAVPDGMAAGVLAGVNPVHGLYASFAGPIGGGLTTSTRLMVITTTGAGALAAGSAVSGVAPAQRSEALVLLTLIAGVLMIAAGVAKLGRYTRFVSHSVMLGFLTGVALNIIFGQLSDLTGAPAQGGFALAKAVDVIVHPRDIDVPSLLVGLGALAILILLARTRLGIVSALIALVVPTVVVLVAGLDTVAQVDDTGAIPRGIPFPTFPDLGLLSLSLITGAASVVAIVLVQGAGVAESAPNPDGPSNSNRDFMAQGAGDLVSSVFGGQPVGGSVGQTALNVTAGARTRWAGILSGVWMIIILVAFSAAVGKVALPTLAAILIYAGYRSLRPKEIRTILATGPNSQIAFCSTLVATLFMPVAAAVGIGVVLSLLLQLNQEAMDLTVVALVEEDGHLMERPAPTTLPSHAVTVLDVYGSLFYAGSRTLQSKLPDPAGSVAPGVVLRLRGRTTFGATFFTVIAGYSRRLDQVGGRLYLTGLDPELVARLGRDGAVPLTGSARLLAAQPEIGASTHLALQDAQTWIVRHEHDADGEADTDATDARGVADGPPPA
jgi:SulP family sulfate permease